MNEVGLVVVTAVGGEAGPALARSVVKSLQDMLEAADALEGLGGETGLVAKELDEAARAASDLVGDLLHANIDSRASQLTDGVLNGWGKR